MVVAVPDSTALAIAYLKKLGKVKAKLIYFAMGLASRLYTLKQQNRRWYPFVKRYYAGILNHCEKIIFLGKPEYDFFQQEFPRLSGKLKFIPFCVDTSFWKPVGLDKKREVLFVGNDINRDFNLLLDIARAMPEVEFTFVSKKIDRHSIPANVELLAGDWRSNVISDEDMRRIYNESQLVILPLKNALQPSGQSVALQAMACATPVIISRTQGFWDSDNFADGQHVILIEAGEGTDSWTHNIKKLLTDRSLLKKLSKHGIDLISTTYSMKNFNRQLETVIE